MPFDVLLAKADGLKPEKLSPVLAVFERIPAVDAARRARECWGIVAEGLEEPLARDLALRLQDAGLPGWAVPHDAVAELPELRAACKLEWGLMEARQLRLIAASAFPEPRILPAASGEAPQLGKKVIEMGILMTTGIPLKLGPKKDKPAPRVESELALYLDLYLADPAVRLRIDAQNFDYSHLKERMGYNVLGNFRTLLTDLAALAPKALRSRGTRVLLEGRPLREMGYRSIADAEREARWLLTIA